MKIVEKIAKTNDFSWRLPYENCQIKAKINDFSWGLLYEICQKNWAKIDDFSRGSNFEFDWKVRGATKFLKHLHNYCYATVPEVLLDIDWRPSHGSTLNDFNNSWAIFYDLSSFFNKIWASCKFNLGSWNSNIFSKTHIRKIFARCYHILKIIFIFQKFFVFLSQDFSCIFYV